MLRTIAVSLVLVAMIGCQSFDRAVPAPPPRLEERLAAIEKARLAPTARSEETAFASRPPAAAGPFARANQPVRRSTEPTGQALDPERRFATRRFCRREPLARTWTAPPGTVLGGPWTLADLGEAVFADETPSGPGGPFSNEEGNASTLRRPPLDSFWETVRRDIKDMPGDLWRDTKRVYANPTNLIILGTAYGGSLALQEAGPDDTVEDHFRGGHDHFDEAWRETFAAAGNPGTHFALAGLWYLVGQQTGDEKTYEVGKTMFSALIINGLTTLAGQAATSDRSPNGEWGTFPSGHTSSSFTMASVLHEAYGHAVGIPLYGLATLVAIERVDDREHDFADVVMGAVLGTVIGHSVATGRDPEFFGWKVLPYADPNGGTGVAFMKTLP